MPSFDLKQANNGFFYLHWTENRRSKRVSTRSRSLDEAKAFLAEWLKLDHAEAKAEPHAMTCAEAWAIYKAAVIDPNVKLPESQATANSIWNRLRPFFADLAIRDVTDETINGPGGYVEKRSKGLIGDRPVSLSTIRNELTRLRTSWNHCAKRRKQTGLSYDDINYFTLPPEGDPRMRVLSLDEIGRLIAAAREGQKDTRNGKRIVTRVELFLWLGLYTAGRKTAITRLTWDRVDFDTMTINLQDPDRPKTKKRNATVPIAQQLLPVLQLAYEHRVNNYVLENVSDIHESIIRLAVKAKVPDFTAHVLRHTFATMSLRNDVSIWKVANILGDTVQTTDKVYASRIAAEVRDAVSTIELGAHAWAQAPNLSVKSVSQKPTTANMQPEAAIDVG